MAATRILVPGICVCICPSPKSFLRPKKTTNSRNFSLVRAKKETPFSNEPDPPAPSSFISQEDARYLIKVGAGSMVGAAAIKYGSVVFPAITTPNISQALIMIFAPVIVAVLLLINQSRDAVDN